MTAQQQPATDAESVEELARDIERDDPPAPEWIAATLRGLSAERDRLAAGLVDLKALTQALIGNIQECATAIEADAAALREQDDAAALTIRYLRADVANEEAKRLQAEAERDAATKAAQLASEDAASAKAERDAAQRRWRNLVAATMMDHTDNLGDVIQRINTMMSEARDAARAAALEQAAQVAKRGREVRREHDTVVEDLTADEIAKAILALKDRTPTTTTTKGEVQ